MRCMLILFMKFIYNFNPRPGLPANFNFDIPSLDHYYMHSLSKIVLGVEKIFKEIMHFHYMTYVATP